jgi:hypothetical protein
MLTVTYMILLLACSSTLGLFGFFVGRCARKLPIIDDKLPWTISRGQALIPAEESQSAQSQASWP